MTHPMIGPRVWCMTCGKEAVFLHVTMDRRYCLVRCQWEDRKGKAHGCGDVLGSTAPDTAAAVADRYQRDRAHRQHPRHPGARRWSDLCDLCIYAERHDLHKLDRRLSGECAECTAVRDRLGVIGATL